MAVRRTREQKLKAQQRRSVHYEWPESALPTQPKPTPNKSLASQVTSKQDPEIEWLKRDVTKTALATIFILLLIGLAYWLS